MGFNRQSPKAPTGRQFAIPSPAGTTKPLTCCWACPSPAPWACSVHPRSRWSFPGCSTAMGRPSRSRPSGKVWLRTTRRRLRLSWRRLKLGEPLTFAMTFPPGTHAMWMRYYLAAGGINADKDVALITIPPPQMVANMKIGKMDGFCVGEPWNARAIADKIGFTSLATQEIWNDHPEKVCAFTAEFADKNPKTVKAVLKALHEASVWLDDMENRLEQCAIVSKPTYINCDKETILGRLQGKLDYGDGRTKTDELPMHFSKRNCNYPQAAYAKWWLTQFRRWGMVPSAPDYEGIARAVMRGDLYAEAMKEIGVTDRVQDDSPWSMFDGVQFDPKGDMEAYAKSFKVNSVKA